jgi:sulfur-oxidizing protein SoxY
VVLEVDRRRRTVLRVALGRGAWALAVAVGWLKPLLALAGEWPKAAFDARNVQDALKGAGVVDPVPTQEILIKAPDIAENGAQVPIEILSRIPGTRTIYVFVDKNPQPMAGSFEFMNGAEPFVSTRIKMGETSDLRIVVRAADKYYMVAREIKVTIGGCGT